MAKKSKKQSQKKSTKQQVNTNLPVQEKEDTEMDFGGIPDRDLKKNLGCG
jgi:hypothetical protein